MSGNKGGRNGGVLYSLLLLAVVAAVFWLALEPAGADPVPWSNAGRGAAQYELKADFSADALEGSAGKLDHIAAFAVIFALAMLATRGRHPGVAFALTFAVAVLVEVAQGFEPSRHAQLQDLLPALIGIGGAYLVLAARARRRAG